MDGPAGSLEIRDLQSLDATMVARTLAERGMLRLASDGFQPVRKIDGANKRVYVLTAKIFDGAGEPVSSPLRAGKSLPKRA